MARDRKPYLLAALATGTLWVLAWPATGSLTPLAFVAWVPLLLAADRYLRAPREVRPRHWLPQRVSGHVPVERLHHLLARLGG